MANGSSPDFTQAPVCKLQLPGCLNTCTPFNQSLLPTSQGWVYDNMAGCYFCRNCRPGTPNADPTKGPIIQATSPSLAQLLASYAAIAAKNAPPAVPTVVPPIPILLT
jgi:hypothetical protein